MLLYPRCRSDSVYDYSGEACDVAKMKVRWVAVITGGVCGTVVFIVILVVCCLCTSRCRRRRNKAPFDDS